MDQHVRVGVAVQPAVVRNRHSAQHQPAPRDEGMHVETVADANGHGEACCAARIAPASTRSEGYVSFTFCALPATRRGAAQAPVAASASTACASSVVASAFGSANAARK